MNKRIFTVSVADPTNILEAMVTRLGIDHEFAKDLLARGAVTIQSKRCVDAKGSVSLGARVTVYIPNVSTDGPSHAPLPFRFIHRDNWVAVVDKPSQMLSQATRGESGTALDCQIQREIPSARLLHRLDRDASGLVLLSVGFQARASLQDSLEAGLIHRRYVAIVGRRLEGQGRIDLRIARTLQDARRRVALPAQAPSGKAAASRYRVLWATDEFSAVELELETGRTHQLRIHLAAIGHPIVGDRLYGGVPERRLALHAYGISFPHPKTMQRMELRAPLPLDFCADVASLTKLLI